MSGSGHFTQNYSLQNKSSPKQTNKQGTTKLSNCRTVQLIPWKTNWQKRLLNTTEARLRANSPFRKRNHTRAACERRHGCVGGEGGGRQREGVSLLFLYPLRLRRSVARSLSTLAARHEWPGACSQAVRKRNSRTQGLISWFMLF